MTPLERQKTHCQMRTFVRATANAMQAGDADAAYYLSRPAFHLAGILQAHPAPTCPDCGDQLTDRVEPDQYTYCDTCDREVHDHETAGCRYLGNGAWDCGTIDQQ